jgi:hypothetical protein
MPPGRHQQRMVVEADCARREITMLVQPKVHNTKYVYDTAKIIGVAGKLSPIAEVPFVEITLDNENIGPFQIALFPTGNNVDVIAQKLSRAFGIDVTVPKGTDRRKLTKGLVSQLTGIQLPVNDVQVFQDPDSTEIDLPWGTPRASKTQKKKQDTISCEW